MHPLPPDSGPGSGPALFRVLFVCIGNVCRSPVGERLLAARLPGSRFEVRSAGVGAMVGYSMSRYAAEELRRYGGDSAGFAARQLTEQMVRDADLVLTATQDLRSQLLADEPTALRRTFTVLEFAALVAEADGSTPAELVGWCSTHRSLAGSIEQDVEDPYRKGVEAHAASAAALNRAVEQIAKGLDR